MDSRRAWIAGLTVAVAAAAGGYFVGRIGTNESTSMQSAPPAPAMAAAQMPKTKPLYYQDPDGKPVYSSTPRKTADGRDFKPVYGEQQPSESSRSAQAPQTSKTSGKGKILYYRNPMGLADTSPVPKKDSMGMDYIPVYEGEEQGVVSVSPERLQMLGVRTAPVEMRTLSHAVRATGTVQPPEGGLADVTTKFDCVVEKMLVSATGEVVHAGQPLARIWIQTPETNMQIGPDVITREIDYVVALQDKNPGEIARAANVLRQYGLPESAIAEIRRTGHATRSVTITAPRDGVILEKPAVEGMHFNTGDPLFKIGDLSTVWVVADVEEQDLGTLRVGQPAKITFVAFPGRVFTGSVDFVYPSVMTNTRTGRARVVLPNQDGLLRESMYASVSIESSPTGGAPAIVVPDSAIIDSGTKQAVLVAKGQGRFEPRAVRLGARGDGYDQILGGLKPGEQVVVGANFLIDAESNLRSALQSFSSGSSTQPSSSAP